MPGLAELVTILMVVLIVFGASKLPEIANAIGRSIEKLRAKAIDSAETPSLPASNEDSSKSPPATTKK